MQATRRGFFTGLVAGTSIFPALPKIDFEHTLGLGLAHKAFSSGKSYYHLISMMREMLYGERTRGRIYFSGAHQDILLEWSRQDIHKEQVSLDLISAAPVLGR